jgi:hypothetical protein
MLGGYRQVFVELHRGFFSGNVGHGAYYEAGHREQRAGVGYGRAFHFDGANGGKNFYYLADMGCAAYKYVA